MLIWGAWPRRGCYWLLWTPPSYRGTCLANQTRPGPSTEDPLGKYWAAMLHAALQVLLAPQE